MFGCMQVLIDRLKTTKPFTKEENLEFFRGLIRVFSVNDTTSIQESRNKALLVWKVGYKAADILILDFLVSYLDKDRCLYIRDNLNILHELLLQSERSEGYFRTVENAEINAAIQRISMSLQSSLIDLTPISISECRDSIIIRMHQFVVALNRISIDMEIEVTSSDSTLLFVTTN